MTSFWLPTHIPPVKPGQIFCLLPLPVVVSIIKIRVGGTKTCRGNKQGWKSGRVKTASHLAIVGPNDRSHAIGATGAVQALPAVRMMARVFEVLRVQTGLRSDPSLCGHAPALSSTGLYRCLVTRRSVTVMTIGVCWFLLVLVFVWTFRLDHCTSTTAAGSWHWEQAFSLQVRVWVHSYWPWLHTAMVTVPASSRVTLSLSRPCCKGSLDDQWPVGTVKIQPLGSDKCCRCMIGRYCLLILELPSSSTFCVVQERLNRLLIADQYDCWFWRGRLIDFHRCDSRFWLLVTCLSWAQDDQMPTLHQLISVKIRSSCHSRRAHQCSQ